MNGIHALLSVYRAVRRINHTGYYFIPKGEFRRARALNEEFTVTAKKVGSFLVTPI